MDVQPIVVDSYPIDSLLTDDATVGPETAHLARVYLATPRALVWRNPSPDWRLFVLGVPLASRLGLMRNPIFANLVRDWGMSVRFTGVDVDGRIFDFRRLLDAATLAKLVDALTVWLAVAPGSTAAEHEAVTGPGVRPSGAQADEALDILFAALAGAMLTMLEARRPDWPTHLARRLRLETGRPDSLTDREGRYPDFLASLRAALRDETIDTDFYGRALRAIDLREESADRRVANLVESCLDGALLRQLAELRCGLHLGCYNWLADSPRHAAHRAYALARLPAFAQCFAEAFAAGPGELPELHAALDSGQDRRIVTAVSQRFRVTENTVRALWRQPPLHLGMPPTWLMGHVLARLDALPERAWPEGPDDWQAFVEKAVPSAA